MLPSAPTYVLTTTCVVLLAMLGCTYEVAGPCDTGMNVSYAGEILPLLGNHCSVSGCHVGAFPSAGLDLSSDSAVAESANAGKLLDRLQLPSTDPRSMPPSGPLSECDIFLFETWIKEGAQTN